MPGPMPNPAARRRNAGSAFTTLPARGRPGPPPDYPLAGGSRKYSGRRREVWEQLWATPMAFLWERHRFAVPVARYVEMLLEYESAPRKASALLMSEMRQAEQLLQLNAAGLLKARATIDLQLTPTVAPGESNVVRLFPPTERSSDGE